MAGDTALYDGHAVAAVAATTPLIARDAAQADRGRLRGAAACHRRRRGDGKGRAGDPRRAPPTSRCPRACTPTWCAITNCGHGDVEAGFAEADLVIEDRFRTEATHQGYIEPHACLAQLGADGKGEVWCCTQGHFNVQKVCAALLGLETSAAARHRVRNRRRFRRQDGRVHRTGGAGAVAQDQPPGEAGDEPGRSVPRDRADVVDLDGRQDRHEEGRHDHRRARACSACRAAPFPARRWNSPRCAPLRPTLWRTCTRSAMT